MDWTTLATHISNFTTVFLGIFIEAVPFLLLGSVASGLVEVFVSRDSLTRLLPRSTILATLAGSLLGLAFPVCECGVIPLVRRLYHKGLPTSTGIAFLLAAPIVNPVTLASTYAAYGWGRILWARVLLGLAIATAVGLIFSLNKRPATVMQQPRLLPIMGGSGDLVIPLQPAPQPLGARLQSALRIGGDEFFGMGRYLVAGSILAALLQTIVPQNALLAVGSGPVVSVIAMQALAYVLSVCSTVDAFLSLAFVNTFTTGSVLGFLVFGPMVDIKSTLMFLGVFRRKSVVYLIALSFLMVAFFGIFVNLRLGW